MEDEEPFRRRRKEEYNYDNSFNYSTLSNLTQLYMVTIIDNNIPRSPATQEHLQRVYGNLTVTTALAAIACYLFNQGFLPTPGLLAMIMVFGCILAASFMRPTPQNSMVRHGALYGFGFGQGWMLSPLVDSVMYMNPETVFMTVIATVLIFGSFTMSAYYSPRRQYLYLGSLLSSAMLILALFSLGNMFFGSAMLMNVELYVGLLVFSLYVLYDTQVIVERAEMGQRDSVMHAATLFTDLIGIFVRLLIILAKDKDKDSDRRGGRQGRK